MDPETELQGIRNLMSRKLSFGKKKSKDKGDQSHPVQSNALNSHGSSAVSLPKPPLEEKKESKISRVLSFGKKKKKNESGGDADPPTPKEDDGSTPRKESVGATIVRKISFGKKK